LIINYKAYSIQKIASSTLNHIQILIKVFNLFINNIE